MFKSTHRFCEVCLTEKPDSRPDRYLRPNYPQNLPYTIRQDSLLAQLNVDTETLEQICQKRATRSYQMVSAMAFHHA